MKPSLSTKPPCKRTSISVAPRPMKPSLWRGIAGFASYYLLRLPYIAYKAWREWH